MSRRDAFVPKGKKKIREKIMFLFLGKVLRKGNRNSRNWEFGYIITKEERVC